MTQLILFAEGCSRHSSFVFYSGMTYLEEGAEKGGGILARLRWRLSTSVSSTTPQIHTRISPIYPIGIICHISEGILTNLREDCRAIRQTTPYIACRKGGAVASDIRDGRVQVLLLSFSFLLYFLLAQGYQAPSDVLDAAMSSELSQYLFFAILFLVLFPLSSNQPALNFPRCVLGALISWCLLLKLPTAITLVFTYLAFALSPLKKPAFEAIQNTYHVLRQNRELQNIENKRGAGGSELLTWHDPEATPVVEYFSQLYPVKCLTINKV